jgi:hypothetical protein
MSREKVGMRGDTNGVLLDPFEGRQHAGLEHRELTVSVELGVWGLPVVEEVVSKFGRGGEPMGEAVGGRGPSGRRKYELQGDVVGETPV